MQNYKYSIYKGGTMKKIIVALLVTISAAMASAQSINCDKQVESYLLSIGNLESESYDVIEVQAGLNVYNKNDELEYNESNFRLSGADQAVLVKMVVESKSCLLKTMKITR